MREQILDKLGVVGAFIAAACCLGLAPILGALSTVGLGFLGSPSAHTPLLFGAVAISAFGYWRGTKKHGKRLPLVLGLAGIAGILFFWFITFSSVGIYAAIAVMIAASGVNLRLARAHKKECEAAACEVTAAARG